VSDILTNPQSEAMVRAIVGLARDLDIATVAEYTEDKRILQRLRKLGVQYAQGYAIDKPRTCRCATRAACAPERAGIRFERSVSVEVEAEVASASLPPHTEFSSPSDAGRSKAVLLRNRAGK
jgi:EAL domain-containing protein (putative c-di-GMP-specific phosphodiesterase class I)